MRILIIVLCFSSFQLRAQLNTDSLATALAASATDTVALKEKLLLLGQLETDQIDAKKIIANWIIKHAASKALYETEAKANIELGMALLDVGDYAEATKYITSCESIAEKNKLFVLQGKALNEMANMYYNNKQLTKAVEYYQKSIALNKKSNFKRGEAIAQYNFAGMLLEEGYSNKDTVRLVLNLMLDALRMVTELKDTNAIITLSSGTGRAYVDYGNLDSSLLLLNNAEKLIAVKKLENAYTTHYITVGKVYNDRGKYTEAIKYYNLGLSYAFKYNSPRWVYNYYSSLAETYEKVGDFKQANKYNKLYVAVHDSLINAENFTAAADIQNKYQREKQEKAVIKLNAENRQKSTLNKALAGTAVGIGLIGFLGYRNFRSRQKLQQAKITELEKDKQLSAIDAMLKGQEEERSRIAKDLHDGLGGMLSGTKLSFINMKENLVLTPENATQFDKSLSMLDNTIVDLRKVAHNLMPEALVKFGLDEAVKDFCSSIQSSSSLKVVYQQVGEKRKLTNTAEVFTYRIIQELVNNAVKHAKAKQIIVQLNINTHKLSITVEDDGKGFDINTLANSKGAGMDNIKYRVQYFNGTLDIVTAPGSGTSVNINLTV
jgi:two-component system, NarL family, sensor kinase